jgi:hypothetical protein
MMMFFSLSPQRIFGQGKPQLKRPEPDLPENKPQQKKPKKGKDPRAVGILQLNSSGKGTLIPVAILVDGRFYDASAYKADPIPMALESGTVYEAEKAGDSQGLFTVNGALHSKNEASAHAWVGSGTYLAQGAEAPKSTRKAEDVPVGLDNSGDEPPRLTRKEASKTAATEPGSATQAGESAPVSGDKATDSGAKQTAPSPAEKSTAKTPNPGPANQTDSGHSSGGQASSSGQASSGEEEGKYYRPTLRRGKPTQSAPAEEDPTAAQKEGNAASPVPESGSGGSAGPGHSMAAISDASGPQPQSYKFFWKTGEEQERRQQMLALAETEVRAYAAALIKNQIPARPAAKAAGGHRKTLEKPAPPALENVQFRGFDVWLTNQPVMILSAEAHFSATGSGSAAEPYSLTLVARTDIYGELRKLYSGVTDKFHLDVTPRLELIDAVDADGDGRGELLFRETSDLGSGYIIYRTTPDKLWKLFDSLNAE